MDTISLTTYVGILVHIRRVAASGAAAHYTMYGHTQSNFTCIMYLYILGHSRCHCNTYCNTYCNTHCNAHCNIFEHTQPDYTCVWYLCISDKWLQQRLQHTLQQVSTNSALQTPGTIVPPLLVCLRLKVIIFCRDTGLFCGDIGLLRADIACLCLLLRLCL